MLFFVLITFIMSITFHVCNFVTVIFFISQVHGKRFVYKFVCDLKSLLGYSASQLNNLVMEAERKLLYNNEAQSLFGNNDDYVTPLQ